MFKLWESKYPDSLFSVSSKNGFLPKINLLKKHSFPFTQINEFMDRMQISHPENT